VSETTRRVLRAILDNSVAIHMNFAGRGGKHGIENMKLMCLVVGKNYITYIYVGICV